VPISAILLTAFLGSISVTVMDATGAVLPGATVEVLQEGAIGRRASTNQLGVADISHLRPGVYLVRANLDGFRMSENRVAVKPGASGALEIVLTAEDLAWYWTLGGEAQSLVGPTCLWVVEGSSPSSETGEAP
jgi:hypothetical protein